MPRLIELDNVWLEVCGYDCEYEKERIHVKDGVLLVNDFMLDEEVTITKVPDGDELECRLRDIYVVGNCKISLLEENAWWVYDRENKKLILLHSNGEYAFRYEISAWELKKLIGEEG